MGMALGVYISENQHIYEDLNESSSARLGGSQQQEIQPSLNSKAAWIFCRRLNFGHAPKFQEEPNFSAQILDRSGNFKGAEILEAQKFTRRGDFNVRHSSIAYYKAHEFCMSA